MSAQMSLCLYNEINWSDIMLGLLYMGLVQVRSMPVRGVCVSECEDGLQMAGWWRFMDEQWLCNVSMWDERGMCDLSAAASTLQSTKGLYWMNSVQDSLWLRVPKLFSGTLGEEKETLLALIIIPVRNDFSIFYSLTLVFACEFYCVAAENSAAVLIFLTQYTCIPYPFALLQEVLFF